MFDLKARRGEIISAATKAFEIITGLSKDIRSDEKERTGIQVLVRVPNTRNLVFVAIKEPSEDAMFFAAEKGVRSREQGDMSSGNSANPPTMQFEGSVSVFIDEVIGGESEEILQASVSGLKGEEDVAVSIIVIAMLLGVKPSAIVESVISNFGKLPAFFYEDAKQMDHYLWQTPGLLLNP